LSLDKYIEDVEKFDEMFGVEHITDSTVANMGFHAVALAGEAGELCNLVKKIWRDGENPERLKELDEEIVDVVIYLIELIRTIDMDFDEAWDKKQKELIERWNKGKNDEDNYTIGYRAENGDLELNRE